MLFSESVFASRFNITGQDLEAWLAEERYAMSLA
jgi:DNA-binding transcriptional regulator YiaG